MSGSTAGAGAAEAEERGEEATSALRPAPGGSSAGGSSSDLPAGAAAASADAAGDGGLGAPLGSSPLSSGTLAWWAELGLEVDEAAAAAGHGNAVRVRLTMRAPRPPPSPFDLSPSASASAAAGQHEAGAAAAVRRSTPATPHPSLASMVPEQPESGSATGSATPGPLATSATGAGEPEAASGSPGAASAVAAGPSSSGASPAGEAAVRDALLVQQFLEGSPSQLTFHGLVALQEGLRPNQLAVFFRWGQAHAQGSAGCQAIGRGASLCVRFVAQHRWLPTWNSQAPCKFLKNMRSQTHTPARHNAGTTTSTRSSRETTVSCTSWPPTRASSLRAVSWGRATTV